MKKLVAENAITLLNKANDDFFPLVTGAKKTTNGYCYTLVLELAAIMHLQKE